MMNKTVLALFTASAYFSTFVQGHGYLKSPRSRNWYASPNSGSHDYGDPAGWESCPHCLNSKTETQVCATGNAGSYDNWLGKNGDPMPWTTQGVYIEGQEIEVETVLTTNHAGHIDMFACPAGKDSTPECFLDNPLTFVKNVYDPQGPVDELYPSRAYVSPKAEHKFIYKLPQGVYGDEVMLQWRYVTANSCIPPGYRRSELNLGAGGLNWMRSPGMSDCSWPPNQTGARDSTNPEQFWNCADIKIIPASPTKSPSPSAEPVPTPVITQAPSLSTPETGGCCTWDGMNCGHSEWCSENKAQCESNCAGTYIRKPPTYPPTWSPVPPTIPTPNPTATMPTTSAPTKSHTPSLRKTSSPTRNPTSSPTQAPKTSSPTQAPKPGGFCCSDNFMTCKQGWCNENEANCNQCSAQWIQLDTSCSIPVWGDCLGQPDACCAPATCHDFGTWAQCRL